MRRWLPIVAAAGLAWLALESDAWARVGGGQNFSSGSGGYSGGSYGGGGDGDGLGLIIYFLLRLCIEYPAIGIPMVLLFVVGMIVKARIDHRAHGFRHRSHRPTYKARHAAPANGLDQLKQADPVFSVPVAQEFLELLHRRALEAVGTGDWDPLAPFVDDSARQDLTDALGGVREIREVVHGGIRLEQVVRTGVYDELTAYFLGARLEVTDKGERRVYFEERWRLRRAQEVVSLPPEDTLRMGCPSCGAAVETDRMGACTQCGTPITKGQLQWQATSVQAIVRRAVEPPAVGFFAGGDEPSVHQPTLKQPDLATQWRGFVARHPDFSPGDFEGRVRDLFLELQSAWSDGQWHRARPFCTEPMYQNLRFYMEQYAAGGLHNRLADISIGTPEIVRVELDAWYESVTVRIWAEMRDWVEDRMGNVVGGNKHTARRFSEYWTFLRAAGTGASSTDIHHCPSCGAPLDKVSAAGICGYCDTKITTGHFDWVLSRIDQTETYQG